MDALSLPATTYHLIAALLYTTSTPIRYGELPGLDASSTIQPYAGKLRANENNHQMKFDQIASAEAAKRCRLNDIA